MTSVEGRVSSGKQERQNTKNRAWYFPLDPPDTSFSPPVPRHSTPLPARKSQSLPILSKRQLLIFRVWNRSFYHGFEMRDIVPHRGLSLKRNLARKVIERRAQPAHDLQGCRAINADLVEGQR